MGRVSGKVALVTGAASGLGEAIVTLLAAEGAKVVLADIADEPGEQVAGAIRAAGGDAFYVHLDVTQEPQWEAAMAAVVARYGKLNIVVNNAGIAMSAPIDMSLDVWRKAINVNLDGTFLGTKHAINTIKASGEPGSIVNMSSVMAMVATPTTAAYCASKAGVAALTKAAAIHCAREKLPIRVNSVHPGTCLTPLVKRHYDTQPPEVLQAQIDRHPIGHLGEPMDIAYGVLYLASDESKFVLGSELVIDGGLLASD